MAGYYLQSDTSKPRVMWDCYQGLNEWSTGTVLARHERESDAGYARRCKGFNSPAIYSYLIDTFDILYAHSPARIGIDDVFQQFAWDAGQGQSLDELLNRAVKMGEVQGSAWLVMDTSSEQPIDLQGMRESRSFPFLQLIEAADVTALLVDRMGRIVYFSYKYMDYDEMGEYAQCYKVYTPGKVTDFCLDEKGNATQKGETILPIGFMPVIPIIPSGEPLRSGYLPASPTLGLYQGQLSIATTNSLIDESLYAQQFSVLVVTGNVQNLEGLKLGTSNVLKLPENATAEFIAPSGTAIDLMLKRIDQAVVYMQKTFANLLTSGESQSGIAKNIDRQVGTMQIKKLAIYMEKVEYKIYEAFCTFMGTTPSTDYAVDYFKDFDMEAISDYIAKASSMLQQEWSPEVVLAVKEDLLKKYFSGADPELLVKLCEAEMVAAAEDKVEEQTIVTPTPADQTPVDNNDNQEEVE